MYSGNNKALIFLKVHSEFIDSINWMFITF